MAPPRARRYLFVATVELTDTLSEVKIQGRTSDLSVYGCRVNTHQPFLTGARVRTRIAHSGASFVALGRDSYTTSEGRLGSTFTHIEPKDPVIVEKWGEEVRSHG